MLQLCELDWSDKGAICAAICKKELQVRGWVYSNEGSTRIIKEEALLYLNDDCVWSIILIITYINNLDITYRYD